MDSIFKKIIKWIGDFKFKIISSFSTIDIFFKLGFTPCQAEQPLKGMELQEKQAQKDYIIQEICLERTYS